MQPDPIGSRDTSRGPQFRKTKREFNQFAHQLNVHIQTSDGIVTQGEIRARRGTAFNDLSRIVLLSIVVVVRVCVKRERERESLADREV
jgi:hypothetical protein